MPSNIVLECAQIDGSDPDNVGSEWTTTLQHPITIEEGDVIQLKQALINTKNVTSGNIVFETDQNVEMTVGFYDNFDITTQNTLVSDTTIGIPCGFSAGGVTGQRQCEITMDSLAKLNNFTSHLYGPGGTQDAGFRVLTINSENPGLPDSLFTRTVKFTIPKGSYNPTSLASLITDKLYSQYDSSLGISGHTSADDIGLLVSPGTITGLGSSTPLFGYRVGTNPAVSGNVFSYQDNATALFYVKNETSPTRPVLQIAKSGAPNGGIGIKVSRLVGARNIEVAFEGSRFKFKSLHSPLFSNSSSSAADFSNPVTVATGTAVGLNSKSSDSGCFFTNLQPASFWSALGFTQANLEANVYVSLDKLLNNGDEGVNYLTQRIIQQDTPTSVASTQLLPFGVRFLVGLPPGDVGNTNPQFADPSLVSILDTTATTSIDADEPYLVDNTGYYLLEATANFNNDYYDQTSRMSSVVAAVSKQYNSNDFITGYADSGIAYTHIGATQILSSLKLRILDPQTKELAGGLGDNSTVVLEVIKAQRPNVKSA